MLKRKIDNFLLNWKNKEEKLPLIVKGARQIGKTTSIKEFAKNYKSFIEINFLTSPEYKSIFSDGYQVDSIMKNLSLLNPDIKFIPNDTLILFDEIQAYPDATTSLKPFALDKRFDVICSGSLLGVNYKNITSIPVGFKEEYEMYSLDFEEFLWAYGYNEDQIEELYSYLKEMKPLSKLYFDVLSRIFKDYIFVGGMPKIVDIFIKSKVFTDVFNLQSNLYQDYHNDITKYVEGLDHAKVENVYRHISSQLAKENHKFQFTKISHGARAREYYGVTDWLSDAGIINIAYNLESLNLPLSSYEDVKSYRIYFADHSLFIATLDKESKRDLIINSNYEIYNGALYESLISEMLKKSGYDLYFYRNNDSTIELDFLLRVKNQLVPIEVKRKNGKIKSVKSVLNDNKYNINYAVKIYDGNINFENNIFSIPHFLTFLLNRFFKETDFIKW